MLSLSNSWNVILIVQVQLQALKIEKYPEHVKKSDDTGPIEKWNT